MYEVARPFHPSGPRSGPSQKDNFLTIAKGVTWLFKPATGMKGQPWAEKIACEISKVIGVECASVELARCTALGLPLFESRRIKASKLLKRIGVVGSITKWFFPDGRLKIEESDVWLNAMMGNELLPYLVESYDHSARGHYQVHCIDNIFEAWQNLSGGKTQNPMPLWDVELEQLASYFLLDGLITNSDRNHTNWMTVKETDGGYVSWYIAPSYDHGSSLGSNLGEKKKVDLMNTDSVGEYINHTRGKVFRNKEDKEPVSPLEAAKYLRDNYSHFADRTLSRIASLDEFEIWKAIDRIPPEFMGGIHKDFAYRMVTASRTELIN